MIVAFTRLRFARACGRLRAPGRRSAAAGIAGFIGLLALLATLPWSASALASETAAAPLGAGNVGLIALALFVLAYLVVVVEEFTHLRKSKPVILVAGIIWILIAWTASGDPTLPEGVAEDAFRHNFLEFAELFCFLLVAMAYINAMTERNVFEALRSWLVRRGFTYRQVFWITGWLAFFISPVADNMTTALLMCAVAMAVGQGQARFIVLSCISIVVAANAGGAFSPFGDITTLMVWQKEKLSFFEFFAIFLPSVVNYAIPAFCMHFALPKGRPDVASDSVAMKIGARRIIALFLATIATTVALHHLFHMPPVLGMLTGLAYLQFFGYYIKIVEKRATDFGTPGQISPYNVFEHIARAEWDTLLFFYGVLMCVGGLAYFGYLAIASNALYGGMSHTLANAIIGVLSAVIDNIPIMFAVLTMNPPMDDGQWLLVTLTAGVGGSLLSIGSAAGVALMGQARGVYTFFGHLKWTWAIALGYVLSIACHLWLNERLFTQGLWTSGL